MSGLRARQKADRERRILTAGAALFRDFGYQKSKIEDIADRADVSIGTVYNYFESKGDLLVAIVSMEVNEVLNAGQDIVDNPPGDVEAAVDRLVTIYLDHSLVYLDKDMWRHAMALSIAQPNSEQGKRYADLDQSLATQVCRLVEKLQAVGRVRSDVDSTAIGHLIFNNTNMMFMTFVRSDDMSLQALKDTIATQNRPIAHAIAAVPA